MSNKVERYLSGSEDRVFYFSDYGEDKIYAVAGYDYNNLSEIKNDAETIFKKLIDRKVNVTVNEITVKYFMNRLENICSMDFARLNMHTITRKLITVMKRMICEICSIMRRERRL